MRKLLSVIMALFVISILSLSLVNAVSLDDDTLRVKEVEVNGQTVTVYTPEQVNDAVSINDLNGVAVEEGERLDVRVELEATQTVQDVEVEVEIRGYEYRDYEDLADRTHTFDINLDGTGVTSKTKTLHIDLPAQLDKDRYFLRLTVDDKDSGALTRYVVLQVDPTRHGVDIADVVFSPGNTVKAGRALLTSVLLQNFGDKDEHDVKVTVAVPVLGVSATEFVDRVLTDDHNVEYEDVPEMFLQIPPTAPEGDYEVHVSVRYDDLRETVAEIHTVHVLANELFQTPNADKLVLAVGPESQSVTQGKTVTYAVALTNAGFSSKAYLLEAVTGDWASTSLSDNLVVLEPGKNKVVYVEVTAAGNAVEGEHLASVAIKSGKETLETVTFKAKVVASGTSSQTGANFDLRNGLEIALIVLVVLLVIIGLIIGFSRLRKDEDEEQTYY
jgi:uncharacterized protein YxeA